MTATATIDFAVAACRGIDPDLFHPDRGQSTREAKTVCASCSVRVACLEWALATHQVHGIWGGTSERERRRIRTRLRLDLPVPELDADWAPVDRGRRLTPIEFTKEPTMELAVAPAPPVTPTNGTRPIDPTTGLPTDACANCGRRYTPVRKDQRFCRKECARAWYASHPRSPTGERRPRVNRKRKATAVATSAAVAPAPAAAPAVPVDLHSLLGQLLAGCDHWTVEADLGDVHVTVSRGA